MKQLIRINKISIHLSIFFLLMGFSACNQQEEHDHAEEQAAGITFTCPMHPQIVEEEPGRCPVCGMDLVAVKANRASGDAPVLMLSESQILLANIKTQRVGPGGSGSDIVLTGRIVENQELREVISSRVPGRIERLYVKETGRQMQAGQPLYDIYSEELLTYQQEFLLALEQFEQLGDEEPRYASFVESARRKLILYGMTEPQIRQLGARKKTDPLVTFVAPVSGVITNISAVEGQYVREGSRLYTLARLDPLWVEAEVYQRDLEKVEEGMEVGVRVSGFSGAVEGQVIFVSPEYQGSSQIVNVRVEIPNPAYRFMPGMQANVLLSPDQAAETIEVVSVPVEAVIRDQEGAHVWIRTEENTFEARKVIAGDASAEQVVISDGIDPDDIIVTSGAYLLYSEFVLKKGGHPLTAQAVSGGRTEEAAGEGVAKEIEFKDKDFAVALAHYMELKNALIASDAERAKAQAGALQAALKPIPEGKEAAEYAGRISETSLLEEQRQHFFFLSNNLIQMAEKEEILSGKIFVQFCPMANNGQGAYWLSAEEEIRNPYLPETMLNCGEVRSVIEE